MHCEQENSLPKSDIAVTAANDPTKIQELFPSSKLDINTVKTSPRYRVMIGGNGTVNLTNNTNGGVIFRSYIDLIKNKLQNLNSASVYAQGDV